MNIRTELLKIECNEHYINRYLNLIEKIKLNKTPNIYEKHHILPKSLFPKFKLKIFDEWNCIKISPREHYILHKILAKAYGNKMLYAFNMMAFSKSNTHKRDYKISSRDYNYLKEKMSLNNPSFSDDVKNKIRIKMKLLWEDDDFRNKMIKIFNGKETKNKKSVSSKESWEDDFRKNKLSLRMKKQWEDERYKETISSKIKDSWTEERKENNSNNMKFFWTEERKTKHSKIMTGKNNPFYNKTHTEESRDKISKANKGKKLSVESRDKISKANKGKKKPEGFGENVGKRMFGSKHKDSSKNKISEKAKKRYENEEFIKKMSEAQKNRKRGKCVHCGVEMDVCNLSKYHNERCKFKNEKH